MLMVDTKNYNDKKDKFYVCNKEVTKKLIVSGFDLLSAIYGENQYIFLKTEELSNFIKGGGVAECKECSIYEYN